MAKKKAKCVIWDLDHTLWHGILAENDNVRLRPEVLQILEELDNRGILQSISSKNDYELAMDKLKEFGLDHYFIYPQINWNPKSNSIQKIADAINIGKDTIIFVDDQAFERDEVAFAHPEVLVIDSVDLNDFLERDEVNPNFITSDSKNRRLMYQTDIVRNQIEESFEGTKEEYLSTLGLVMKITPAEKEDLKRIEELTVRTSQLNSTGLVYTYDELVELVDDDNHDMYIVQLDDCYGTYGKVGLALVEKESTIWCIKLLIMSCRVISRGVGNVLLYFIINKAKKNGKILRASFIPTERNKIMYITYKFSGFKEIGSDGEVVQLQSDSSEYRQMPNYVEVIEGV